MGVGRLKHCWRNDRICHTRLRSSSALTLSVPMRTVWKLSRWSGRSKRPASRLVSSSWRARVRRCGACSPRWRAARRARAWDRLGYVRLRDYAVERLGHSARQVQDLAHVDRELRGLPQIEAAFVAGRITWTRRGYCAGSRRPRTRALAGSRAAHDRARARARGARGGWALARGGRRVRDGRGRGRRSPARDGVAVRDAARTRALESRAAARAPRGRRGALPSRGGRGDCRRGDLGDRRRRGSRAHHAFEHSASCKRERGARIGA